MFPAAAIEFMRCRIRRLMRWPAALLLLTGIWFLASSAEVLLARGDTCPLPADLDGSGVVDVQDITLVAGNWHGAPDNLPYDPDLDHDGDVDVVDIMLVAADWGQTGSTPPRLPGDGLAWAEGSTRKVRLTDAPPASTWVWDGCRIHLHAASNETEPVQLVITAGTQDLTGVSVTVSDLTNGSDTIGQSQIALYREAYYNVPQPSDPYGYGLPAGELDPVNPGVIPDALIPFEDPYNPGQPVGAPFGVSAGENQPVWIDLAVPTGTPPGTYQGTITITTNEGPPLDLPLELVVWNFTLPSQPSLSINFTLDPLWTLPPQYGVAEGTPAFYDLIDREYEALAAHRLGPVNLYRAPSVNEAGGQVQLDWTPAESLYQHWLDTRALPAFYIPDVYDGGTELYRIIDDSTGKPYTQAPFNGTAFSDPVFVDKVKQYYTVLRNDLQSRGWWDRAWVYPTDETEWVADEPEHNGPSGYQRLQAWAQLLKDVNSDYRIMASIYPIPVGPPDRGWLDLKGLVDDWNVLVQDADLNPALWESRQALGETLSFYYNDWGDLLDYKATLHRGLGWVAYKYNAWDFTGWAAAAWIGDPVNMDIVNPWTTTVAPSFGYGGGAIFWPGKSIEGITGKDVNGPLPSIRLKLAREAVDDHDYLTLLAAQTSPDYARALVRGLIPRDYWDWDPAPEAIYALRDRIGRLLDSTAPIPLATVQGQVTDAASGAPIQGVFVTDGESGALTDATGHYTVTVGLPAVTTLLLTSGVSLSFSAPRYQAASRTVTVSAGGLVTQDVALTRVTEQSRLLYSFETAGEVGEWEFANTQSVARVTSHTTDGSYALKVVFNDSIFLALLGQWPAAGVGTFPTQDWSGYTSLEFDMYNESDYYTNVDVYVADADDRAYPQSGGTITLLPNQLRHVVIPMAAAAASGLDLTRMAWFEIDPETITEEENYQEQKKLWRVGPRTLYLDNLRLVRVVSE